MVYIYSLIDPRNPNIIRYVGKTKNPKKRIKEHINDSKRFNDYKSNWIKSLLKENISPIMNLIIECDDESSIFLEKHYISVFKSKYLTNSDEGGHGNINRKREIIENANYRFKRVYQYNLDGIFLNEFKSVREASRKLGICHSNITRCCNGVFKHTKGFIFKYDKIDVDPIKNPNAIKKNVVEIDNSGLIINEWKSISDCSKSTGIDNGNISKVCNKKIRSIKGRIFIFK